MKALVGYTGFVGSNICEKMHFDKLCNSKNVEELYDKSPSLLIYAGVRGTKFLANSNPEEDKKNIECAIDNIKRIKPQRLVLISTVDVYDDLDGRDESYDSEYRKLHVYGKNRLELERWVRSNVKEYHIVRIPALFGVNLKKNFIHDLINPVPVFLSVDDIEKVSKEFSDIFMYYQMGGMGAYEFRKDLLDLTVLNYFSTSEYNSLRFTDSRAQYQFFNLAELSYVIGVVIEKNIELINVVTEPISANELYKTVYGQEFNNFLQCEPIKYNLHTRYGALFFDGKKDSVYFHDDKYILSQLKQFIEAERGKIARQISSDMDY